MLPMNKLIEAAIGEVPDGVDTATQRISSLLEREEKFVRKIVSAVRLGYSTDFWMSQNI